MIWQARYKQAHHRYTKNRSPGFFAASGGDDMLVTYPQVKSTNGLRRAIINFMIWEGHHLEATNTMGVPVKKFAPKMNLMTGQVEQINNGFEWRKGSGMTGSSDAKGHINHPAHRFGIPLYVEIKYNKDRMRDEQEKYEAKITATGGVYVIAKTIEEYLLWYDNFVKTL